MRASFPWMGVGDCFRMIQVHHSYCVLCLCCYYISSTSDHQALDPAVYNPAVHLIFSLGGQSVLAQVVWVCCVWSCLVQSDVFLGNESTLPFLSLLVALGSDKLGGSARGHCGCSVVVTEFVLFFFARNLTYKQNRKNGSPWRPRVSGICRDFSGEMI